MERLGRYRIRDGIPADVGWFGLAGTEHDVALAEDLARAASGDVVPLVAATLGNLPLGTVTVDLVAGGSRTAVIRNLVVLPPYRGRGLGSILVWEAESLADGRGLPAVELTVPASARGVRRFARRLGYRPVGSDMTASVDTSGPVPMVDAEPAIVLRRTLHPHR